MGNEKIAAGIGMARNWVKENVFQLITILILVATTYYNIVERSVSYATVVAENSRRIDALEALLDRTVTALNTHLSWSEGRSSSLTELKERVERLEKRVDAMDAHAKSGK